MNVFPPVLRRLWAVAAVFCIGLASGGAAWAADLPGRVGRLADSDGQVWLREADQNEWIAAGRNRPLTGGDRLAIEGVGRAELHIGSTTLRIGADSDIEFASLDDERVRVVLHRGSLALRVRSDSVAGEIDVLTDEGSFRPQRAGHYRVDHDDRSSFAQVWSGDLRFQGRDSALVIQAGQRAEFWRDRGVTHYTWAAAQNDRFADWALASDREEQRYANSRYVSPEITGAVELDRYGRWDRHPEYGSLWFPSRVEPGWAPYRVGHWAWVRPWGWTWVDDAPWGFAPFHYGRWVNWQGRWGWAPGNYTVRPAYAPALVAWIGSGNVSLGISVGGPTVGWVPLAPREVYVPYYHHSPHHWQRVNPGHRYDRRSQPVRTGPIMYTNQGVPGGVTVVPSNVLRERQPVARAVIGQDFGRQGLRPVAAPPPADRVIAEPGGGRRFQGGRSSTPPEVRHDDTGVRDRLPPPQRREQREAQLPSDPALMRHDDTGVRDRVGPQHPRDRREAPQLERPERPERLERPERAERGAARSEVPAIIVPPEPAQMRRDDTGVRDGGPPPRREWREPPQAERGERPQRRDDAGAAPQRIVQPAAPTVPIVQAAPPPERAVPAARPEPPPGMRRDDTGVRDSVPGPQRREAREPERPAVAMPQRERAAEVRESRDRDRDRDGEPDGRQNRRDRQAVR